MLRLSHLRVHTIDGAAVWLATVSITALAWACSPAASSGPGSFATGGAGNGPSTPGTGGGVVGTGAAGGGLPGSGGALGTGGVVDLPAFEWVLDRSTPLTSTQPSLNAITSPIQPQGPWGVLETGPKPTNVWWLALTIGNGDPLITLPYHVWVADSALEVALPTTVTTGGGLEVESGERVVLGASGAGERFISESYDIGVSVTWNGSGGTMTAPIISGMAYATMLYEGLTPRIVGLDVNGTGTRFEGQSGGNQWVVYTSEEVTFNSGTASAPLNGWVRVALVPDAAAAATFDAHAAAVPRRGIADFARTGGDGYLALTFDTEGSGEPLMMALPHHLPRLEGAQERVRPVVMNTIKGDAQGVVGQAWALRYPLGQVGFSAPRPIDPTMENDVRAALQADSDFNPGPGDSVYWSGKDMGKLARLVLIADELGETGTRDTLLGRLKANLEPWLNGASGGNGILTYDTTWGGIVNGCVQGDLGCDYGQGRYNDHHFQYGYLVYAGAVIAKFDAGWASTFGEKVEWLIRDYANPSRSDPHFVRLRHFDAYAGHSWSMGLDPSGAGRNQESSSEAVAAYYAIQLWGEATGNQDLENFGNILRIAESTSAQAYWQIRESSEVYDAPLTDRPCVGILWGGMAELRTFFSGEERHICGMQMIPVTPATEDLISTDWIAERWDSDLMPIAGGIPTDDGFRAFFAASLATWDKQRGCEMIHQQTGYDNGNSHTNMLYYCATRP